jgi:hypothetical protein
MRAAALLKVKGIFFLKRFIFRTGVAVRVSHTMNSKTPSNPGSITQKAAVDGRRDIPYIVTASADP